MKCKKILAGLMLGASLSFGLFNANVEAAIARPADVRVQETNMDFKSAKIDNNIIRIRNGARDLMYLIEGNEYAALIDTGVGAGDLRGYVETLTDKPIIVLITHGHVDHASGTAQFDEVYMSRKDRKVFREHTAMANRIGYSKASSNQEWAKVITEANYQPIDNPTRFKNLAEGMTFDLGGVHLDIYDIPGHTPGSIAILIRENRALLTGDGANMFTFLFSKEASGLNSFENALKRLKAATDGKYDKVYCSHGYGDLSVDYLDRLIEDCEIIKAGLDDKIPFDFMGNKANIAFEIDWGDHNRVDGGIGNIVYDPERINE